MCKRTIGVPQELGRSVVSSTNPGRSYRVTNSRPRRRTRPPRSENSECNRGTAKRRKRSAAGWAAGSRSTLIVLMKPGNWSHRTRWREGKTERGCLMLELGPGNTSEASYLEPRITVTTQDSSPGIQICWYGESIIRGTVCANVCTYGSVGGLGGQPPRPTRP